MPADAHLTRHERPEVLLLTFRVTGFPPSWRRDGTTQNSQPTCTLTTRPISLVDWCSWVSSNVDSFERNHS